MLVHHPNTIFNGFLRIGKFNFLTIEDDFPLGRLLNSKKNFHQGGFPRAIFTNQSVDLPFNDAEIYFLIRNDTIGIDF